VTHRVSNAPCSAPALTGPCPGRTRKLSTSYTYRRLSSSCKKTTRPPATGENVRASRVLGTDPKVACVSAIDLLTGCAVPVPGIVIHHMGSQERVPQQRGRVLMVAAAYMPRCGRRDVAALSCAVALFFPISTFMRGIPDSRYGSCLQNLSFARERKGLRKADNTVSRCRSPCCSLSLHCRAVSLLRPLDAYTVNTLNALNLARASLPTDRECQRKRGLVEGNLICAREFCT